MKTTIKVHHTEMITPPRCRKARPQQGESEITVTIREVSADRAPVAFIVSEYDREPRKVRHYNGKLYRQAQRMQPQYLKTNKRDESRPFWLNIDAKTFRLPYSSYGQYYGCFKDWIYPTLESCKKEARKTVENYIIVDGEAYERTGEPYYFVNCFGLGRNHGGTGFFVGWADYRDRKSVWGMTAADHNEAIEKAVNIALRRGDTESVDYIRRSGNGSINVLMPEAIKRKYVR